MAERRRTFGPVVLAGLACAGLAAYAGSRAWATFTPSAGDSDSGSSAYASSLTLGLASWPEAPLVSALAYVVLAAWGVLLVTRGRFRRAIAVLALFGSLALVIAGAVAFVAGVDTLDEILAQPGISGDVTRTAWPFVAVAAGVLSVLATIAAVRLVPSWPEMGSRYDAPGTAPQPVAQTSIDLWRALDEGRDPTLPADGHRDP